MCDFILIGAFMRFGMSFQVQIQVQVHNINLKYSEKLMQHANLRCEYLYLECVIANV